MSKDKSYKCRAVCPICNKPFDTRKEGAIYLGDLICNECYKEKRHYNQQHEFMK